MARLRALAPDMQFERTLAANRWAEASQSFQEPVVDGL